MTYEQDTPPGAENVLQGLSDDMETAREGLREARNDEVQKEHAYKDALRQVLLSDECPKVGVKLDSGERVTVAKRDAWAAHEVADLELEWQIAKATRKAASDHLNTLKTQASVGQSIASSVRETYRGTGRWDS